MTRHCDGHVSLLVQFRPPEVAAAARRLAVLLAREEEVVMTLDPQRGNLELANVRGVDLRQLTDWLYRKGARCVFVRYPHEAWPFQGAGVGLHPGAAQLN